MSTYLETLCTQEDMQAVLPSIGEYNRNTVLTQWPIHSGDVYKNASPGRVDVLYRDGAELTSVGSLGAVTSDGQYYYDSAADIVYLFSQANPALNHTVESGKDFSDTLDESRKRASELVRSIIAKPIYKKKGVGYQGETARDYDEVLILSAAAIAVALMVRPFDVEFADQLEEKYNNETEPPGILQLIRAGFIKLHHEISTDRHEGNVTPVSVDSATTGGIVDISGTPSRTDVYRIQITTGGTLTYGTASPVKYKVLSSSSTGVQTQTSLEGETITGGYDTLGGGLRFKASQGVYTADDYWFVDAMAGTPETQNPVRTTKAKRY